jgi:threonine/homoserine/homoserine lactone efflux protein
MTYTTLAAFALVALIGIATPGPTVILAFGNGARHGVAKAVPGMLGAVVSDFLLIGAVALGLGALLAASEFWFSVVKWVGVAYLAWIGFGMLRSTGSLGVDARQATKGRLDSPYRLFRKCFLVAATNPKGYLFFSAFLPQFIDPTQPQAFQYAILALIFATIDLVVMLGYAVLGAQATRTLKGVVVVWLDRVCGGALLALAGSLALYRRAAN